MNAIKHNASAGYAALEKFVTDAAARHFFANPKQLSDQQKYEIVTEYLRERVADRWMKSKWHKKPKRYFLSFEYSFGKPSLHAEYAMQLSSELDAIAKIMGSTKEALLSREDPPKLGYGTLGRFSEAWISRTSNEEEPWMGYGLRYRSGFYHHQIIDNRPVEAMLAQSEKALSPWEISTDRRYKVRFREETVIAVGIDYPILSDDAERIDFVRLWSAEESVQVNVAHFKEGEYVKAYVQALDAKRLVEFLYPAETNEPGKKLRLMQEYFFSSATAQDLLYRHFSLNGQEAMKVYINEIHPVFVIPEMIRLLMEEYSYSLESAVNFATSVFSYGNQILSAEAFERWPVDTIEETIPHLLPYLKKLDEYARQNSSVFKGQSQASRGILRDEQVHMYNLALYFTENIYTFSETHRTHLMGRLGLEEEAGGSVRIMPVIPANVHLLKRYNSSVYQYLHAQYQEPQALAELKLRRKEELATILRHSHSVIVNEKSIYNVHIGNFHENNRQLLIVLHIAELHRQLLALPQLDIPETTFFFAGKAYPGYLMATEIVHLINAYSRCLTRDNLIHNKLKIVFMENLDVEMERNLLLASDIYQPIRLPEQATLPMNMNDAILNGSAVIASTHGYTKKVAEMLKSPGNLTLFNEYSKDETRARESLQFLLQHKQDLGFDISTIISILNRYQDSFRILSSFSDFYEKMLSLTKSYFNEESWNTARASEQLQMWEYAMKMKGNPLCDGR